MARHQGAFLHMCNDNDKIIEPTLNHTLVVWWSYIWRAGVFTIPFYMAAQIFVEFALTDWFIKISGEKDPPIRGLLDSLILFLISIAISIYLFNSIFRTISYRGFRVCLLKK